MEAILGLAGTLVLMALGAPIFVALGTMGAFGTLGILIPPSLSMILYGLIAEQSVPRLFLAGVIPGLIQAVLLAIVVMVISHKRGYASGQRLPKAAFIRRNLRALPALFIPVSVFVGIYSGITTVTESAGVAAVAAILIAVFVYREIGWRDVFPMTAEAMKAASAVTFIVMFAMLFAHWITGSGTPTALVLLIVTPIVLPLLHSLGIDPIHFGIILIVNMEIAFLTPPIGLNLFVLSSISRALLSEAIRRVVPFIAVMFAFLMLVTYVPEISPWLPTTVFAR